MKILHYTRQYTADLSVEIKIRKIFYFYEKYKNCLEIKK